MRPLRADDRAAFIGMHELSRGFFAPWMPIAETQSLDELFDQQLQRTQSALETGKDLRLTAFLRDDRRLVGMFNLNEIIRGAFCNAFAGWKVSADLTRQGFGTEGVNGLLDVAFASPPTGLGLHRVQANIVPTNLASLALAEKVGFRREGLAKAYLKIAGEWRDHVMLAKLAVEHAFVYLTDSR